MLYCGHSQIKVALAERLIRTIWLFISRYYTLKNTTAFVHDLDKIMFIYIERPRLPLSNFTPLEAHRGDGNTIDTILKQSLNETGANKKFNFGDTVQINQTISFLKKGFIYGQMIFWKCPES